MPMLDRRAFVEHLLSAAAALPLTRDLNLASAGQSAAAVPTPLRPRVRAGGAEVGRGAADRQRPARRDGLRRHRHRAAAAERRHALVGRPVRHGNPKAREVLPGCGARSPRDDSSRPTRSRRACRARTPSPTCRWATSCCRSSTATSAPTTGAARLAQRRRDDAVSRRHRPLHAGGHRQLSRPRAGDPPDDRSAGDAPVRRAAAQPAALRRRTATATRWCCAAARRRTSIRATSRRTIRSATPATAACASRSGSAR